MKTFKLYIEEDTMEESWKSALAGIAMMGAGAMTGAPSDVEGAEPATQEQPQQQQEESKFSVVNPKAPHIPSNALKFKGIVVHHSDSSQGTAQSIDSAHKKRKDKNGNPWQGIGYNYVILKNGNVQKGRTLTTSGAHAGAKEPNKWHPNGIPSRNSTHIGIVLVKAEGEGMSQPQRLALGTLINSLAGHFNLKSIERHHEQCPGKEVPVETLNDTLKQMTQPKYAKL